MDAAVSANHRFAFDLYGQIAAENPGESIFFSPFSVSTCFAMPLVGAGGPTADEMFEVLGYGPAADASPAALEAVHAGLGRILNRFEEVDPQEEELRRRIAGLEAELADQNQRTAQWNEKREWRDAHASGRKARQIADQINELKPRVDQYEVRIANALWGDRGFPFSETFVADVDRDYGTGHVFPVDFGHDPDAARQEINEWVALQTRDRIRDLIPPDMLDAATRLVLTNAIYFLSEWSQPFAVGETRTADFHLAGDVIEEVALMCQPRLNGGRYGAFNADGSFFPTPETYRPGVSRGLYPEPDGFAVVEIPYRGGEITLVVVAPNRPDGLSGIEDLLDADRFDEMLDSLQQRPVSVYLPRFEIEETYQLADAAQRLGMKRAFTVAADFSGMTAPENPENGLFLSQVVHKAYLKVNEKGTEAAAATGLDVMMGLGEIAELPFTPVFRADRPFLFFIRDSVTNTVLFMGRLVRP